MCSVLNEIYDFINQPNDTKTDENEQIQPKSHEL